MKALHDIDNILARLKLMAELLDKRDFTNFSEAEIRDDFDRDLQLLKELFAKLGAS